MRLSVILAMLILAGCERSCLEEDMSSVMPLNNVKDRSSFFEVLGRREVTYQTSTFSLGGKPSQEYICTSSEDDEYLNEALWVSGGRPSFIDYEAVYTLYDRQEQYLAELRSRQIQYVISDDIAYTQKSDRDLVNAAISSLGLMAFDRTSIGFGTHDQAQRVLRSLSDKDIVLQVIEYDSFYYLDWGDEQDDEVQKVLESYGLSRSQIESQLPGGA